METHRTEAPVAVIDGRTYRWSKVDRVWKFGTRTVTDPVILSALTGGR